MSAVSRRLLLGFVDAAGRRGAFSIPRASAALDAATVRTAALGMIMTDALMFGGEPPAAPDGASAIETERRTVHERGA